MSHRWDCPTDYEARRQGERDYENRGYRSYATPYDDVCPEAADAYLRGQRSAEYEAELEAEDRAARRRDDDRRRQEQNEFYRAQEEAEYEAHCRAEIDAQYERDIAAAYEELEKNGELDPPAPEKP